MTSCAFPSSVTASRLWSFQRNEDLIATPYGWPDDVTNRKFKTKRNVTEEESNKILDFDRLENDIIKHVLDEEDVETSQDKFNNVFPSFNYIPLPIPKSFLKSNPILKLYPRNVGSVTGLHEKSGHGSTPQSSKVFTKPATSDTQKTTGPGSQLSNASLFPKIPEMRCNQEKQLPSSFRIEQLLQNSQQRQGRPSYAIARTEALNPHTFHHNMPTTHTHQSSYSTMPIMTPKESNQSTTSPQKTNFLLPFKESTSETRQVLRSRPHAQTEAYRPEPVSTFASPTPSDHAINSQRLLDSKLWPVNMAARNLNVQLHETRGQFKRTALSSNETTKTFAQIVANKLQTGPADSHLFG